MPRGGRWLLFWIVLLTWSARAAPRVEIDIEADRPGREVNRLVLGSNVQWVDRGDGLLNPGANILDLKHLERAGRLAPTSLRYPGGAHSDIYHWRGGVGPPSLRSAGTHAFSGAEQAVIFGTDEFLLLCRELGAEPLLTVNMVTGDADEAADWLAYVNRAPSRSLHGRELPRVRFWELGNEPYLIEERQRKLALSPDEYVRKVNLATTALRAVDPSVKLGVALRSTTLGGVAATPFPGFNARVLAGLQEPPDFVAVHNAYAPYLMGERHGEDALFRALMAAPDQVSEDLDLTQQELRRRWPDLRIGLAVTEYAAFFGLSPTDADRTASMAAALFAADLLRVLAAREDIVMAHHWSLIGNWRFGAIALNGERRPVFEVLRAFGELLHGRLVPIRLRSHSLRTGQVGMVGPRTFAAATALAVRHAETMTVFIVNRDSATAATVELRLPSRTPVRDVSAAGLSAAAAFSTSAHWRAISVQLAGNRMTADLPPHSLSVIRVVLGSPSP